MVPIEIDPLPATVTAMVAVWAGVEPSATVTVAVPALTDVMAIFPLTIAAVATPGVPELADVPTTFNIGSSAAVLLSVAAAKTTADGL